MELYIQHCTQWSLDLPCVTHSSEFQPPGCILSSARTQIKQPSQQGTRAPPKASGRREKDPALMKARRMGIQSALKTAIYGKLRHRRVGGT